MYHQSVMKYKQFTIEEREKIQEMLWQKSSIRTIAATLGRSASSVSREISRNLTPERHRYTPRAAHERALKKRQSRGRKKRLKNEDIRQYVTEHLKMRWSPEQITGRINSDLPGSAISYEAIYQFIYYQIHRNGYGYLKPGCEDLRPYLRRRRKRRIKKGSRRCQRVSKPKGASINNRPLIINERKRLGDWEGDTVESRDRRPGINTLVERTTGLLFITKLNSKNSRATTEAVSNRLSSLPKKARQSLTIDNGPENSDWPEIEKRTGLKCYYANAYHSWERGTNENTNGLIRDYFPKGTDFTTIPEEELKQVEYSLNARPRKRLGWLTPLEALPKELGHFNIILNPISVALEG